MNLVVIDASALVHSGSKSKYSREQNFHGFPTGGINRLMREIIYRERNGFEVVVCFDSKTNRRELYPNYKSNRVGNKASSKESFSPSKVPVYRQLSEIYPMLLRCGYTAIKIPGMEADDIIAQVIADNYEDYDRLDIVGTDYDLLHSLDLEGKVKFQSANSILSNVSANNYDKVYKNHPSNGTMVPFGTISAYKVFYGDKSDCISMYEGVESPYKLYTSTVNLALMLSEKEGYATNLKNKEFMQALLDHSIFSKENKEELMMRIDLIYPRRFEGNYKPRKVDIDLNLLRELFSVFGLEACAKVKKMTLDPVTEEQLKYLQGLKSNYYTALVDEDIPVNTTNLMIDKAGGIYSDII